MSRLSNYLPLNGHGAMDIIHLEVFHHPPVQNQTSYHVQIHTDSIFSVILHDLVHSHSYSPLVRNCPRIYGFLTPSLLDVSQSNDKRHQPQMQSSTAIVIFVGALAFDHMPISTNIILYPPSRLK